MYGKETCKILRQIRRKIARENDIPYDPAECTHQGCCAGTCPRCESEVRYLEKELEKRRLLGRKAAVAALAVGISLTAVGCGNSIRDFFVPQILSGMVVPPEKEPTVSEIEDRTEGMYILEGEVASTEVETSEQTMDPYPVTGMP